MNTYLIISFETEFEQSEVDDTDIISFEINGRRGRGPVFGGRFVAKEKDAVFGDEPQRGGVRLSGQVGRHREVAYRDYGA